jgi:hypothetical protein
LSIYFRWTLYKKSALHVDVKGAFDSIHTECRKVSFHQDDIVVIYGIRSLAAEVGDIVIY